MLQAVLWTIVTVVLVVLCLLLIVGLPIFPGRKRMGDVQEQGFRKGLNLRPLLSRFLSTAATERPNDRARSAPC